mmetsp:Transcript_7510/g.21274  ORF Transcript_7510/g.21274 Transcript_7510/m.21274 type:complete len:279 (-) Transcript_7510:281-1117(-)
MRWLSGIDCWQVCRYRARSSICVGFTQSESFTTTWNGAIPLLCTWSLRLTGRCTNLVSRPTQGWRKQNATSGNCCPCGTTFAAARHLGHSLSPLPRTTTSSALVTLRSRNHARQLKSSSAAGPADNARHSRQSSGRSSSTRAPLWASQMRTWESGPRSAPAMKRGSEVRQSRTPSRQIPSCCRAATTTVETVLPNDDSCGRRARSCAPFMKSPPAAMCCDVTPRMSCEWTICAASITRTPSPVPIGLSSRSLRQLASMRRCPSVMKSSTRLGTATAPS